MPPKGKPQRHDRTATNAVSQDMPRATVTCTLPIKAIPNAPRNEIVGWLGDALKVKIHAPPVEGKANEALCEFLADAFGLPRRAVTVLRGDTSRQKLVQITGLTLGDVKARVRA
jgi:uncharacterized protein (TIGR00251 family)